jgi:hypothetical protein
MILQWVQVFSLYKKGLERRFESKPTQPLIMPSPGQRK